MNHREPFSSRKPEPDKTKTPRQEVTELSYEEKNQEKLQAIHASYLRTPMWKRIAEATGRAEVKTLLEMNFESLGRKLFRVMQQENQSAGEDPEVIQNLRHQKEIVIPRNLTDPSFTTLSQIEAATLINDSERFLRDEIIKSFGLGRN